MPGQSDDAPGHNGNDPPGHDRDDNGSDDERFYTIDETVELESIAGKAAYIWDIETDPNSTEQYTVRLIARNGDFNLRCYIVPREEVESYRNGNNIWWEFRSDSSSRVSVEPQFGQANQDPYEHAGDYSLIVETISSRLPDNPMVSLKFKQSD